MGSCQSNSSTKTSNEGLNSQLSPAPTHSNVRASVRRDNTSDVNNTKQNKGHVMISYDWSHREVLKKISDKLRANGYDVWMDIDNMGGSSLEAMAEAVEKSRVVLICMSQKYQESASCKTEAQYAYQMHKNIVALNMENDYTPSGWLGFIINDGILYDFSGKYDFERKYKELLKQIDVLYGEGRSETNDVQASVRQGSRSDVISTKHKKGHIMISYDWSHLQDVIRIRDTLKAQGYSVWMNIENMGGSSLQTMAEAVEKSHVVLICMSQKYQESASCRAEAEYAFEEKKEVVALLMEQDYKPNGWLALIVGNGLSYDFSGKYPFEAKREELLKRIDVLYGVDRS